MARLKPHEVELLNRIHDAEYECPHGQMPPRRDMPDACGCWTDEAVATLLELHPRVPDFPTDD